MIHPGGSTFLAILRKSPRSNLVYHLKKEQGERAFSPLLGVGRRHHKAPLRGARVRYRATRDARSAGGGRDDQVDVGFGQDSGIYRGFTRDLQGIGELINECRCPLSHHINTSYQPCTVGLRYNTTGARGYSLRGSICYD